MKQTIKVTQKHLDRAIKARENGEFRTKTCLMSQAFMDHFNTNEVITQYGNVEVTKKFLGFTTSQEVFKFKGMDSLMSAFDNGNYSSIMLPTEVEIEN